MGSSWSRSPRTCRKQDTSGRHKAERERARDIDREHCSYTTASPKHRHAARISSLRVLLRSCPPEARDCARCHYTSVKSPGSLDYHCSSPASPNHAMVVHHAGFLLKEIWPFRFWQWCLPRLFQILLLSAFGTDTMPRVFMCYLATLSCVHGCS